MAKRKQATQRKPPRAHGGNAEKLIMQLQDLSRRQLARRLHDGPVQSMAAVAMQAAIVDRLLTRDLAAATNELGKLEAMARRTTRELRNLQFIIRPKSLETGGLAAALTDLAEHDNELYGPVVKVDADPKADSSLSPRQQDLLFQIAVEAVNNAHNLGLATRINLSLKRPEAKSVLVEIEDNGSGFELEKVTQDKQGDLGLGLGLMKLRAKILGAKLVIDTKTGMGTAVRVTMPIK